MSRPVEGHRRMRALALMAGLFAGWWLLVLVTGDRLDGTRAVVPFAVAIAVLGVGECIYDAIQGALVSDLAPQRSAGRYQAASGFGWQVGFVAAPVSGGVLLAAEPRALPLVCAGLCAVGATGSVLLERALPARERVTPRLGKRELPERLEVGQPNPDEA